MTDNPNLAALKRLYAGWNETRGGNAAEILEVFDEVVEMHSALCADVAWPVAGVKMRREEAAGYFEGLLRDWEMLYYDVERFIVGEGDDEIVMVGRCAFRTKATGGVVDTPKIDVHSFNAEGKVVRFQEAYDTLGFARALGVV
jgi:ketosteroid isomerase-like protein